MSDTLLFRFYPYSTKIAAEAQHGLISQVLKDYIFSQRPNPQPKTEVLAGWSCPVPCVLISCIIISNVH